MRFVLIDRIIDLQPGQSLVAVKNLSLAEEYLADHFPGFPVMPGVLMLEALTQAGAWLIRDMEDFAHSVVLLKQAKTIKYGSFVEPGRQLQLRVELAAHGERESTFKGVGIDRRPGDGQGAVHPDPLQPARPRPGAARHRRRDRRRACATSTRRSARARSGPRAMLRAAPTDGRPRPSPCRLTEGLTGANPVDRRPSVMMLQGFGKSAR